jgi:hypothetical protein
MTELKRAYRSVRNVGYVLQPQSSQTTIVPVP